MAHETLNRNGFRIDIVSDENPQDNSPRDWTNNGLFLACNHRRYELGDHPRRDSIPEYSNAHRAFEHFAQRHQLPTFARWARIYLGATTVLPVYLYDHSALSVRAGRPFTDDVAPGGWDSGLLGFIFDLPRLREETGTPVDLMAKALVDEVDVYNQFLGGDVWGYEIYDANDDLVESCYGFFGIEAAREAALEDVPSAEDRPDVLHQVQLNNEELAHLEPEAVHSRRLSIPDLIALGRVTYRVAIHHGSYRAEYTGDTIYTLLESSGGNNYLPLLDVAEPELRKRNEAWVAKILDALNKGDSPYRDYGWCTFTVEVNPSPRKD